MAVGTAAAAAYFDPITQWNELQPLPFPIPHLPATRRGGDMCPQCDYNGIPFQGLRIGRGPRGW